MSSALYTGADQVDTAEYTDSSAAVPAPASSAAVSNDRSNGRIDPARWRKMTAYPRSRRHSADAAPRVPLLKLSINRTADLSSGAVVPPEVTSAIGRGVPRGGRADAPPGRVVASSKAFAWP
eukprot:29345-Pelagococcus_subviridis.AAC.4